MISTEQRERLAQLMDDRRIELDLTWEDVARDGEISLKALGDLRKSDRTPSRRTMRRADIGLRWEPGSTERALNGGDPVPLNGHPAATPTPLGRRLMQRRRELSEAWADRHVFAAAHGVSYEFVAELESGRSGFTDDEMTTLAAAYQLPAPVLAEAIRSGTLPGDGTAPTDPSEAKLLRLYRAGSDYQKGVIMTVAEQVMAPQQPAARTGTTG